MSYQAHYEIRKNSAPVDILFVHGNIASRRWWYPVAELLEGEFKKNPSLGELKGTMVFPDLRGCGLSDHPTPGQLRVDDLVSDLIAVTEKAGLKNVLVVGHSAGGLLTALLLARRPDLYRGALMVDPAGPTGLVGVPDDIEAKYQMMAADRNIAAQIVGFTIYKNDPDKEFFKTVIMDDAMTAIKKTGIDLVRALQNIDYTAEISTVKQPVVVFHGVHDWVLDEGRATDHCKVMANSRFVSLPDNGHCLIYENPERLKQEILDFISENKKILSA